MTEKDSKKAYNSYQGDKYYPAFKEDEINLFEFLMILVNHRKLVIVIFLVFTLGGVLYSLSLPKIYRAEVDIVPPEVNANSNLHNLKFIEITNDELFHKMSRNLQDQFLQDSFLSDHKELVGSLFVYSKNNDNPQKITVVAEGINSKALMELVNGFAKYVNQYTIQNILDLIKSTLSSRKEALLSEIEKLRNYETHQQEVNIAALKEALSIAKKLNITEIKTDYWTASTPMYLRGTEALSAEIEILENRKKNDNHIGNLRVLKEELKELNAVKIKEVIEGLRLQVASINYVKAPPEKAIKPDRRQIIVIAVMLGIVFSVFFAFIKHFIKNMMLRNKMQ